MKKFSAISAFSLSLIAFAAPSPASSISGIYLGGNIGFVGSSNKLGIFASRNAAQKASLGGGSFIYGFGIGLQHIFSRILFGVEFSGEFDAKKEKGRVRPDGNIEEVSQSRLYTLGLSGRLGLKLTDKFYPFVRLGVQNRGVKFTLHESLSGIPKSRKNITGYSAGFGLDYITAGGMMIRAEYAFQKFENLKAIMSSSRGGNVTAEGDPSYNLFRIGLYFTL